MSSTRTGVSTTCSDGAPWRYSRPRASARAWFDCESTSSVAEDLVAAEGQLNELSDGARCTSLADQETVSRGWNHCDA